MMTNPYPNPFIVIEGIDGCGKDTVIDGLKIAAYQRCSDVFFTQELTDSVYGSAAREVLANKGYTKLGKQLSREDIQLLFIRDRVMHRIQEVQELEKRITLFNQPVLRPVFSNRDWESTCAYYGGDPQWIIDQHEQAFQHPEVLKKIPEGFFVSDLTVILDVTAQEAMRRQVGQGKTFDHFEDDLQKREKTRNAYLKLPHVLAGLKPDIPWNIQVIDGMRPKEAVLKDVIERIETAIKKKKG